MSTQRVLTFVAFCTVVFMTAPAQPADELRLCSGNSFISESLGPNRGYTVTLFNFGYARQLVPLTPRTTLNAVVEAQYGRVHTHPMAPTEHDVALVLHTEFTTRLGPQLTAHVSIGTGPGYQSTTSPVQTRGFVFANYFVTGLRISLLNHRIILDPQFRFRHLSNGGIRHPNAGIDSYVGMLGIGFALGSRNIRIPPSGEKRQFP